MPKPTNTVIITDQHLLDPSNSDILQDLLTTLNSILPTDSESIQISNLKSLNRLILVFKDSTISQTVFDVLTDQNIKCNYSMKDNIYYQTTTTTTTEFDDTTITGSDYFQETKLLPPERKVELQSPPASPYLGYVQKPEDPPDILTVTDPKSFSHLLYQPTIDYLDKEKVFEQDASNFNSHEDDEQFAKAGVNNDIPILIIDREEAEILRNGGVGNDSKLNYYI